MRSVCLTIILTGICVLLSSCANERAEESRSEENWSPMDFSDFKVLVEEKSSNHQSWAYHGTVENFHYFTRSPGRAFVGKYLYIKVSSDQFPNAFKVIHLPNKSKLSFQSYVFTKAISLGGGFNHKISRNWVAEPLLP